MYFGVSATKFKVLSSRLELRAILRWATSCLVTWTEHVSLSLRCNRWNIPWSGIRLSENCAWYFVAQLPGVTIWEPVDVMLVSFSAYVNTSQRTAQSIMTFPPTYTKCWTVVSPLLRYTNKGTNQYLHVFFLYVISCVSASLRHLRIYIPIQ